MAEILTAGYEEIRKAVDPNETHSDFNVIELSDGTGTAVLRRTTSDSSVSVTSSTAANPYKLEITVNGDDGDVSLSQTFGGSTLFHTDTDGSEVTPEETFTDVTLEDSSDQLVVTHKVEIPQI